ncbi:MAG: START domain-containing protein [Bacteroidia bacterium]
MKLLIIFYSSLFVFSSSGTGWEQKLNKNGVVVYLKTTNNSKIKSVKAVVTINASPEKIKSVILNIANYPNWVYQCSKAEIISKTNDNELYYYQLTKAPFPVSDRDMAVLMKVSEITDEITITIKAKPDKISARKDIVRIELFDSIWILKKIKDNTEVTNEITTDPGGSVPAWLINSVIASGPYNTVLHLKQIAEKN